MWEVLLAAADTRVKDVVRGVEHVEAEVVEVNGNPGIVSLTEELTRELVGAVQVVKRGVL